jgi:integrase
MSSTNATPRDPQKRYPTRHRGITYRVRANGSRLYSIFHQGRYVKAGATLEEALTKQAQLRQARGQAPSLRPKSFEEIAEAWLASKTRINETTRQDYRDALDRLLIPRFGKRRIQEISADEIAELIRERELEGRSASTIRNTVLKPLSGIFKYAIRKGLVMISPASLLTDDERPAASPDREPMHGWSDEQIAAATAAAEELDRDLEVAYAPLIRLLFETGLRLGEATGLQWQDVDLPNKVIHVRRQFTKSGKLVERTKTSAGRRTVPITDAYADTLSAHHAAEAFRGYAAPHHPVFAGKRGTPINHSNFRKRGWYPALEKAGLPPINPTKPGTPSPRN